MGRFNKLSNSRPDKKSKRAVCDSVLKVDPEIVGRLLASPFRRIIAFVIDILILVLPSMIIAGMIVYFSLSASDPEELKAIKSLFQTRSSYSTSDYQELGSLVPLLVRIKAAGVPPSAITAAEEGDLVRAGKAISEYDIMIAFYNSKAGSSAKEGYIQVDISRLLPKGLRSISLFGVAALYFSFFTSGNRKATPGKWIMRIQVLRLDGRPLNLWESFERYGGYLASLGTLSLGLLDLWRDRNNRLAHDRIANTVVVRRLQTKNSLSSKPEQENIK